MVRLGMPAMPLRIAAQGPSVAIQPRTPGAGSTRWVAAFPSAASRRPNAHREHNVHLGLKLTPPRTSKTSAPAYYRSSKMVDSPLRSIAHQLHLADQDHRLLARHSRVGEVE